VRPGSGRLLRLSMGSDPAVPASNHENWIQTRSAPRSARLIYRLQHQALATNRMATVDSLFEANPDLAAFTPAFASASPSRWRLGSAVARQAQGRCAWELARNGQALVPPPAGTRAIREPVAYARPITGCDLPATH